MTELFDFNQVYYKVIRQDLTHYGFTYQLGLNVDHHPFNPNKFYAAGGLHFIDKNKLDQFLLYGHQIATISIPKDSQVAEYWHTWKADKIFIHEIKPFRGHPFFEDEDFCLDAIRYNTIVLSPNNVILDYVAEKLKTKEFYFKILRMSARYVKKIPKFVKTSAFYQEALENNLEVLFDVPLDLKTYELCLLAVSRHGRAIQHVPREFQTSELLLTAIRNDCMSIEYISAELLQHDLLLLAAVQPRFYLGVIPAELLTSELYLLSLGSRLWKFNHDYIPTKFKTKEFYTSVVKKYPYLIPEIYVYMPREFKTT